MESFREECSAIALARQAEQEALDKKYQDLYTAAEQRLQRAIVRENPEETTADCDTANLDLTTAAECGDTTAVFMALASGADVDHTDENGFSALMLAAYGGHPGVARVLLEARASMDMQAEMDFTAMIMALSTIKDAPLGDVPPREETVRLLVEADASLDLFDQDKGGTALLWAASVGSLDSVKLMVAKGAKVNSLHGWGFTAVMEAASEGHVEVVKFLVQQKANLNLKNDDGKTAMALCKQAGHSNVEAILASESKAAASAALARLGGRK